MPEYPYGFSAADDDMSLLPNSPDPLDQLLLRDVSAWQAQAPAVESFAARMEPLLAESSDEPTRAWYAREGGSTLETRETPDANGVLGGASHVATRGPEGPGPRRGWLAVAAIAAVVLLLVGLLQFLAPLGHHPAPTATPTVAPTTVPTISLPTASPNTPTPTATATPVSPSPFAPVGEPVEANGVVYVTTNNGYLYALSANDGRQLWRYYADAVGSGPPTMANGVVYFGAQDASSPSGPHPAPSFLYAVDASSGALIWRVPGHWYVGKLLVANGVIYAGSGENATAAYRASDGAQLWTGSTGGGCGTNALASDANYLYVNEFSCYGTVALRLGDGSIAWQQRGGSGGAPTLVNGVLYVGIQALSASNGSVLRTFQASGELSGTDAVMNGAVFIATDQSLSAWSTTTGAPIWQTAHHSGGYIYGVGNGALYANDGYNLSAYQPSNGALLWSAHIYPVVPQFDPLPTSLGSTLYVGTLDGMVVALRASDGSLEWRATLG